MQKVNMVDLSIIILSYKSKDHLLVLLPSIFGSLGVGFDVSSRVSSSELRDLFTPRPLSLVSMVTAEVIVVDNDSRDGTAEWVQEQIEDLRFKDLKIILNKNNGFAAGNNLGIKNSSGKYILLLNPDTKLEPDTLQLMLEFMESSPEVGISGCKLVKGNGKLDLASRRRFPKPWNSFERLFLKNNTNYNYSDRSEDESMEVDSVVGAFLLIRRTVTEEIGLLDEAFFMYGEDLDWCFRSKEAGYKVWYYPKATAYHYKGESSKKVPFRALWWFHNSMWIFYKKHYWNKYPFVLHPVVWLGVHGRLVVLIVINIFRKHRVVSR